MIWFTSDLHLGHRAAISMCERPFKNVEEIEVVGCCTDICVLNLALPLKNYFNQNDNADTNDDDVQIDPLVAYGPNYKEENTVANKEYF